MLIKWIIRLTLLLSFSINSINGFEPRSVDPSIVTNEWALCPLHTAIINKNFEKALRVLEIKPTQVWHTSPHKYEGSDERLAIKMVYKVLYFQKNDYRYYYGEGYSSLELAILCDAPIDFIETLIYLHAQVNFKRVTVISQNIINSEVEVRTPLFAAVRKMKETSQKIETILQEDIPQEDDLLPLYEELQKRTDIVVLLLNSGADLEQMHWVGKYWPWYVGDGWGSRAEGAHGTWYPFNPNDTAIEVETKTTYKTVNAG